MECICAVNAVSDNLEVRWIVNTLAGPLRGARW